MSRDLSHADAGELAAFGRAIDRMAHQNPELIHCSPVWCAFVHAFVMEVVSRRNWSQLQHERGCNVDTGETAGGFAGRLA